MLSDLSDRSSYVMTWVSKWVRGSQHGSLPAAASIAALCLVIVAKRARVEDFPSFLNTKMSAGIANNPSEPKIDEKRAIAMSLNDANLATDPPPDGGYGWVCVASVFIINGFTWGLTAVSFSPGTSFKTLQNSKHSGIVSLTLCTHSHMAFISRITCQPTSTPTHPASTSPSSVASIFPWLCL